MKKEFVAVIIILAVVIYLVIAGFSNLMLSPKKITNQGSDVLLPLERLTPKQVLTHRTLDGRGDLNCDSLVDFADINPFVMALSNPTQYAQNYPGCDIMNGDINCNNHFGFDDINPFVACLTQGACPHYEACAFCGDGVADPGEDCDDDDLNGQTCQTLGYDSGDLTCNEDCTFNTGDCQQGSGEECTDNSDCTLCYQCVEQQCVPKDELCADFYVEELVHVDPITGEETWREIDLENEQIEKGLKVKFDASVSSGNPARYYWDWGDGTYGSGLTDIHQYSQQRIVTLSIYTADWSQWGTIQKTIHVNSGMQPVFNGILNTYPSPSYVNGNDFWYYVLGTSGYKLGHLNLSSVYNTKEEYSLPYGPYSVYDFDANSNYLFTIRNNDNYNPPMRLDVRVADIANPELITFYTSEDFGLSGLHQVAAVGNYLYIGSYSDNELKVYDFSNPQSPQFVSSLTVPYGNGIDKLEKIGDKALALLTYNYPNPNRALIIDIKNPTDLHIVEMPSIEALNKVSVMAETTAAFYNYSTWKMVELNIPQQVSEPITISDIWDFSIGEPYGQNGQRLYGTGGSYCAKYDITDKDNAYQMDQSYCGDLGMNGILAAFLHDPDSEGPEEPHFYAVGSSGSYRVLDLGEN